MRQALKRHPDSRCIAATHIDVEIACPQVNRLVLSYTVTGKMDDIRIPPLAEPKRGDELWQHTCFEAFIGASSCADYYEFNFAPSTQWGAYRFGGYRSGMTPAGDIGAPSIGVRASPGYYTLEATLELDRLSALPRDAVWRLGLSAVIEDTSGQKSYWALAHPAGKPDFHHAGSFAHEFAPGRLP